MFVAVCSTPTHKRGRLPLSDLRFSDLTVVIRCDRW
jgi:hypothetical protein